MPNKYANGQHVIYKTIHGTKIRCKVIETVHDSMWGNSVVLEVIYKSYPAYKIGKRFTTYENTNFLYSA